MKKMLSLAAMFAVLSYAAPASAELKIGGDASVRMRAEFNAFENDNNPNDNVMWQYRLRLNGSADLGDGYFFKTMLMSEDLDSRYAAGGWRTVGGHIVNGIQESNSTPASLAISQVYFGRNMKDCNYSIGRIPLNSFNNPIFDLALYPTQPLDTPVNNFNYDRLFGANYTRTIGNGTLNGTFVVMNNLSTTENNDTIEGDGLLNDGYGLHLSYKTAIGAVTVEPQALLSLTNMTGTASPQTFGLNATIPVEKSKIGVSAFYTICDDTTPANTKVDYNGYLVRLKGESGNAMAWVDYNATSDDENKVDYDNLFVWAQYKFKMHESATGTFSLTPTLRYRASGQEGAGVSATFKDNSQLRAEMVATVTF